MRPLRRDNPALCLAAALLLGGCVGTDVGNPPDDRRKVATLSFQTYDAETEVVADPGALTLSDGSQIEHAWLVIESASLVSCDKRTEQTVHGPFVVEVVTGAIGPRPIVFEDVDDTFCDVRVQLEVAKSLPQSAPSHLVGRTVFVAGHTADDVPYTVASDLPRTLSWHGDGLVIDAEENRFVTTFVPTRWLDDIDTRSNSSDNAPVDLSRDSAAVSRFLANLLKSSRIVKDANRDDHISRHEYDRPSARPAR
mgnify:CR=1 FL=1